MLIDTESFCAAIGSFISSSSSSLHFDITPLKYLSLVLKYFTLSLRFPGIFICYIFLLCIDDHFSFFTLVRTNPYPYGLGLMLLSAMVHSGKKSKIPCQHTTCARVILTKVPPNNHFTPISTDSYD